jgi:predicted RND superfamily exporter protein
MNNSLAALLVNKKAIFFICYLVLLGIFGSGTQYLKTEAGYRIFFDEDNPQLVDHIEKENTYSKNDNIAFIIEAKSGEIFSIENLNSIEEITTKSWEMPNSVRVNSLTNFQHTLVEDDELIVRDLYASEDNFGIAETKTIAIGHEEINNYLVSEKSNGSVIQVKLDLPEENFERIKARNESVSYARNLAAEIESSNIDLSVHLAGRVILNKSLEEMVASDAESLFPIMFLVLIIVLLATSRSVKATVACLFAIITTIIMAYGFMGWVGFALTPTNSQISIILITITICNCVHLMSSYRNNFDANVSLTETMKTSLEKNIKPIFITNITTMVGFLTMNLSDIPPFREVGNATAFGIFISMLTCFLVIPFLVVLMKVKFKKTVNSGSISKSFVGFLTRRSKPIAIVLTVLTLGISSFTFNNEINDDLVGYFGEGHSFRTAAEYLENNITGFDSVYFSLDSGGKSEITGIEYLNKVEAFDKWLGEQDTVIHVKSFAKIMKRLNKNMNGGNNEHYKIPNSKEEASQFLLLYELSLPLGHNLDDMIDFGKTSTLVTVTMKGASTKDILALEEKTNAWFDQNAIELKVNPISVSFMFAHIGHDSIKSMVSGSFLAVVLISLIIFIALKSFKMGAVSLLANGFPALVAFGTWGLLVGEVNMPIGVIFSVTLGVIVDDTVHILTNYIKNRREKFSVVESLENTFSQVGGVLTATTITLTSGFLVLAMSDFTVNSILGIMVVITILSAYILDFLLLPLILILIDKEN